MTRRRPSISALRQRVRPPRVGRFGRHGNKFGWTPAGERSPLPRGAGARPNFVHLEGAEQSGKLRHRLFHPFRRTRSALWRRAAVLRRSPLLRGHWLPESRLGRIGVAVLSVVTFGAGLWGIVRSSALDVDHIIVEGAVQVPPDAARAASGIHTGDPLFAVDVGEARAALEALPFVNQASVTRSFPNRVEIRLAERQPVAVVPRPEGGFALLDASGRVLADAPERPAGLAEVTGAGAAPPAGAWLQAADPALEVMASLPEGLRSQVSSANVTTDSVTLLLVRPAPGGTTEVRIGRAEQLPSKAAALVALLERLGTRAVAYIDVRVPDAPVVGPVNPPAPPAPPTHD